MDNSEVSTFLLTLMKTKILQFKKVIYISSHQNHQNIVLVYCLKSVIHLENFAAGILRKFQPIPEFPDSRE